MANQSPAAPGEPPRVGAHPAPPPRYASVYENALVHELRKSGLAASQQHPIIVRYGGTVVGEYTVDLLVKRSALTPQCTAPFALSACSACSAVPFFLL
jgi:hypothetical protein